LIDRSISAIGLWSLVGMAESEPRSGPFCRSLFALPRSAPVTLPSIPAVLDHVAVAVEHPELAWPRYAIELGGRYDFGAPTPGFSFDQVIYANGMHIEVLAPHRIEENDFLRRFLDQTGPAAHHLTFKVPDLIAALPVIEAHGLRPVGVDIESPFWRESFLHPKDGPGIVIQIAQQVEHDPALGDPPERVDGPNHDVPGHFPASASLGAAASLDYVGLAVASIDREVGLFCGLLNGVATNDGVDAALDARWVEVAWDGPGRIRLLAPLNAATGLVGEWLGDRRGRLHHIALTTTAPVTGSVIWADGRREVQPADNFGVRLLITTP
jgi:hypothetical protein